MKDGKYGFIYITTNLVNGKKYIGQKMYNDGWETYLGSGVFIKKAIKKYGKENFKREMIEECENRQQSNEREIYWIKFYDAVNNNNFYNMAEGGKPVPIHTGADHYYSKRVICLNTLEIFDCISGGSVKYGCDRHGISVSCNDFLRITQSERGNWLTWMFYDDYKNATEEFIKNKLKRCDDLYKGIYNPRYGRKLPKEIVEKMKTRTYENRKKTNRKVICLTTNKIFESVKEAQKYYDIEGISACCRDISCYSGNYNGQKLVWMYYNEYLNDKEKVKNKIATADNYKKPKHEKKVKCLNTGEIFNSMKEAAEWCNSKNSYIGVCCNGKRKNAGKHPITGEKLKWEYVN